MKEAGNANISLRALTRDDVDIFRTLRLRALREHPGFFLSSAADAGKHPASYWLETLDGNGKRVFGLFDGARLIGLTGVFTSKDDPAGRTAVLAMSYIEPGYRRAGLSRLLYEARIEWARAQPQFTRIVVSHREGNEASRRANQAFGFRMIGSKVIDWPDGTRAPDYTYELRLREPQP